MSKNMIVAFLFFVLMYMAGVFYAVELLWLLKVIPIAILVWAVLRTEPSSTRTILLFALLLSGCGDLLLAFDKFIYGVAAFLIAQLSYALIFKSYWKSFINRWPITLLLFVYMLVMAWLLLTKLGELTAPVMAYLVAIAMMGFLAINSSLPMRWAVLGAMVFIVSDSLIAVNKFLYAIPFESYWIMISYYSAQFMLVTGLLRAENTKKTTSNHLEKQY